MLKVNRYKNHILLVVAFCSSTLLLSACGASSDVKTPQVLVDMKNLVLKVGACNTVKDPYFPTLEESIGKSNQIFLGKVTKFDPYIWNTPDGKAPTYLCTYEYDPYLPVHIQVLENLKGNLVKNLEVTLLVKSQIIGKPPYYLPPVNIELDKENVWFTGESTKYPEIYARYYKEWNGWDGYLARGDFASIDELKSLITKASATPTTTNK